MIMNKKIKGKILYLISFTRYLKLKDGTYGESRDAGVTEKRVSAQALRFWLCAPAVVVTPLGDLQLGVFVQPDWA